MVGWLDGWLIGWLVGWSVGRSVVEATWFEAPCSRDVVPPYSSIILYDSVGCGAPPQRATFTHTQNRAITNHQSPINKVGIIPTSAPVQVEGSGGSLSPSGQPGLSNVLFDSRG